MQVRLYSIIKGLNEVCLGELAIYYSFKMPVAYRRKKTLIVRDMDPRHLKEIVSNRPYEKVEKGKFLYALNRMIEAEISDLHKDIIKIRGRKKHEQDKRDCRQSEPGAVVDFADRHAKKRQSGN
jgi:hypothetical protein